MNMQSTLPSRLKARAQAGKLLASSSLNLMQISALRLISKREPLSNDEIAEALGLTPVQTTRLLRKLEDLGMVHSALGNSDLRRNEFRLSARAHSVLFEARNRVLKSLDIDGLLDWIIHLEAVRQHHRVPTIQGDRKKLSQTELLILLALDKPLRVCDITDLAGMGQSSVSMALRSLQKIGLTQSSKQTDDQRARFHRLTKKGAAVRRTLVHELEKKQRDNS